MRLARKCHNHDWQPQRATERRRDKDKKPHSRLTNNIYSSRTEYEPPAELSTEMGVAGVGMWVGGGGGEGEAYALILSLSSSLLFFGASGRLCFVILTF